jgi:PadR family transcriptional regulator PadR
MSMSDSLWENNRKLPLIIYSSCVDNQGVKPTELVQGALDLLILHVLALEPQHGWAIANRIRQVSKESLQVQQGSLYPALHRLEQQGWIVGEWKPSENGRTAKYYSLTDPGRQKLADERALWERLSAGITLVLTEA